MNTLKIKAMSKTNYPECEKLQQASNTHGTLNEFIEWLYNNGYYIKHFERKSHVNRDTIVYDFMDVDTTQLEKERRAILKSANP